MSIWNQIAQALRDVDKGLSSRVLEWPVEAVVHAALQGSHDFADALGVDGAGTWVAGRNGLADSTRCVDGAVVAGVEVKITAQENAANYSCSQGCTRQLKHLAHLGKLVIVTSRKRADKDGATWPSTARIVTLTELAEILEKSSEPPNENLVRALFGLQPLT